RYINEGEACNGTETDNRTAACNVESCPVECVWGEWSKISTAPCSVTCGGGTQLETWERRYTNEGEACNGTETDNRTAACNVESCPVECVWGEWSKISTAPCSVTCGGGTQLETWERRYINEGEACNGTEE
ncbi:unnamed protein product, partial [Owenia fusiformis]